MKLATITFWRPQIDFWSVLLVWQLPLVRAHGEEGGKNNCIPAAGSWFLLKYFKNKHKPQTNKKNPQTPNHLQKTNNKLWGKIGLLLIFRCENGQGCSLVSWNGIFRVVCLACLFLPIGSDILNSRSSLADGVCGKRPCSGSTLLLLGMQWPLIS